MAEWMMKEAAVVLVAIVDLAVAATLITIVPTAPVHTRRSKGAFFM